MQTAIVRRSFGQVLAAIFQFWNWPIWQRKPIEKAAPPPMPPQPITESEPDRKWREWADQTGCSQWEELSSLLRKKEVLPLYKERAIRLLFAREPGDAGSDARLHPGKTG